MEKCLRTFKNLEQKQNVCLNDFDAILTRIWVIPMNNWNLQLFIETTQIPVSSASKSFPHFRIVCILGPVQTSNLMQRGTQKFKAPLLVLLYTHLFLGFFYPKTRRIPNLSRKPYTEYFGVLSMGIKTVMQPALNIIECNAWISTFSIFCLLIPFFYTSNHCEKCWWLFHI